MAPVVAQQLSLPVAKRASRSNKGVTRAPAARASAKPQVSKGNNFGAAGAVAATGLSTAAVASSASAAPVADVALELPKSIPTPALYAGFLVLQFAIAAGVFISLRKIKLI